MSSPASSLRIAYGGHSMVGAKQRNEDAFAAILPSGQARLDKGAIAAIADGMSCGDNAQVASQTAVGTFIQDYLSTPETWDVKTAASRVLSSLNSWLYYQGQSALTRQNGFVTTFSSVIIKSTAAHLLHCGDSRIYRWRDGQLLQLTADHTLLQAGGNVTLTRALSMDTDLKVDYQQRNIRVGDLLMLTTDGIHETLKSMQLTELLQLLQLDNVLQAGESANAVLEKTAQSITHAALDGGSSDNLTCLLLMVLELPMEDIGESQRKLKELAIPPALQPGHKLDGYNIQRVLHSSARSHVYLATHPRYRQKFVIKAPAVSFSDDPHYLEAFIRQQWVAHRVDSPALMRIYEPVPDSRFLYHICEYIEGCTLLQWIYDHPQPPLQEVRSLAQRIGNCLQVLQRQGLTHRDLRPDNLMVTPEGLVKLIDFGTVQSGEPDIFSLGVIVYEMLTGALPYEPTPNDTSRMPDQNVRRYQSACNHRKDLPRWFDLALRKACAPEPSERYNEIAEFLHDLAVPNTALLAGYEKQSFIQRHPVRVWQGESLALAVVLVLQALLGSGIF